MSSRVVTWVLVAAALASFGIAFIELGLVTYLDYPLVTLAITAAIAAVMLKGEHASRVVRWRVFWAFGVLLAWALLSAVVSGRVFSALFGNPGNGWGWMTMVAAVAITVAASGRRKQVREVLVAVAPWVVLIEAVVAIYEWATKIWPAGTMSNPSYLLLVMGMLLPLTVVTPQDAPAWQRRLRQVALAAGLFAVGISGARVGFVLVALWAAWGLWQGTIGSDFSERWRRMSLVAFALLAVPAGVWTYLSGGVGFGGFLGDRMERFGASWSGMLDRPIIGWGPDGFFTGAAPHATAKLLTLAGSDFGQFGSDPHNFLAWTAVSLGVVGLALLLWVVLEVGRNWLKQHRAGVLDSALVWGFVLFALQCLFAPAAVQAVPLASLMLGASLAVERSSSQRGEASHVGGKRGQGRRGEANGWFAIAGRALQIVFLSASLVLLAYGATRLTLREGPQNNDPLRVEKAARFWSDPYLWYQADLAWSWAIQRQPSSAEGNPELMAIQEAVTLESRNAVYLTDLARTIAVSGGSRQEVAAAFDRVYEVFPLSPDARSSHALYLLSKKDSAAAWEQLEPVKDMQSVNVWDVLSRYHSAVGDAEKAKLYQDKLTAKQRAQDW